MRHLELIADGVIAAVKSHVSASLAPVLARLGEFEQRLAAVPAGKDGAPGAKGEPGVSVDHAAVVAEVTAAVLAQMEQRAPAEDTFSIAAATFIKGLEDAHA